MKLVAILLGCCALTGALLSDYPEPAYRQGREYVYKYEVKVVTGVPHFADQHGGLVLRAQLRLKPIQRSRMVAQMSSVELATITADLQNQEDIPEQVLEQPEPEVIQQIQDDLQKPIIFKYEAGAISDVQIHTSLKYNTINLVKGLLNLLKLKLEDDSPEGVKIADLWRQLKHDHEPEQDVFKHYKVLEDGISGVCESAYLIRPHVPSVVGMRVTKIRNLQQCPEKPVWEEGILSSLTSRGIKHKTREPVDHHSSADYKLLGQPQDFLIQQVNLTEKFIVQPMSEKHGLVVTSVNQSLALESVKRSPYTEPPRMSLKMLKQPLKFEFPQYNFDQAVDRQLEQLPSQERISKVEQILDAFVSASTPVVRREVFPLIHQLKMVVSKLSKEDLKQVLQNLQSGIHGQGQQDQFQQWEQQQQQQERYQQQQQQQRYQQQEQQRYQQQQRYLPEGQQQRQLIQGSKTDNELKKQLLLDVATSQGTPEVFKLIVELIDTNLLNQPSEQLQTMLKEIALTLKPNKEVLELLKPRTSPLFTSDRVIQDRELNKTVMLTVGSILHRVKVQVNNSAVQRKNVEETLSQIVREIQELFNKANIQDKIIIIKAMANSGLPQFLPLIKDIIREKQLPTTVRLAAVFAPRRLIKEYNPLVHQVLLPLYTDQHEPHELRIAAYALIMDRQPDNTTLEMIVETQQREKSIQVGTFVYNHMLSNSKAQLPGLAKIAASIKKILPRVRPFSPKEFTYSMPYHQDLISEYMDIGVGLDVHKVHDTRSPLPSFVVAKLSGYMMGKSGALMEVGVQGQGLKLILSKLFGQYQYLLENMEDKTWDQMIDYITEKRVEMPEYGQVREELMDIDRKLGIQERQVAEDLNLKVYIKYLGNELNFFNLTKEDILQLSDQFSSRSYRDVPSSGSMNVLRALVMSKQSLKLPTSAGLAFSFNTSLSVITRATGSYQRTPWTYLQVLQSILGYKQLSVNAQLEGKTSLAAELKGVVGVDIGILSAGVTYKNSKMLVNLPVDLDVEVQKQQGQMKVEVKYSSPDQKRPLLRIKCQPAVFVCQSKCDDEVLPQLVIKKISLKKPLINQPVEIKTSTPIEIQSLGIKLDIQADIQNPRAGWMRSPSMFTETDIVVDALPIQPSEKIVLKLIYSKQSLQDQLPRQSYGTPMSEDIDPSISGECKHHVQLIAGPEQQDPSRTHSISAILAHSPRLTVSQLKLQLQSPSMEPRQHNLDILLNLKSLTRTWTQDQEQALLRVKYENEQGTDVTFQLQPQTQQITYDSAQSNILYKLIKEKLDIDITASKQQDQCPAPPSRKFNFVVQYSEVSENIQSIVEYLNQTMAYRLFPTYVWESGQEYRSRYNIQTGSIKGEIKVIPRLSKAIIQLQTPSQRQLYAEYPTSCPLWSASYEDKYSVLKPAVNGTDELRQIEEMKQFHRSSNIITSMTYGQCEVRQQGEATNIRTFDKKTFRLPELSEHQCQVVLAKDCSPSKLFTLLMKHQNGEKQLQLLVPQHKIQINQGTSWMLTKKLQVIVDGQEISVPSGGEEKELTDNNRQQYGISGSSLWAKVSKQNDIVHLELTKIGLIVSTDGQHVSIKLCDLLRATLCGLCGDFNGEPSDDFRNPALYIHQSERPFVADYLLPSGQCPVDRIRDSWDTPKINRQCHIERKTNIGESRVYGRRMTCVSVEPSSINVCSEGCVASRQTVQRVGFHCIDSNSMKALSIKQRVNSGRTITDELSGSPIHKYEHVVQAQQCVPEELRYQLNV